MDGSHQVEPVADAPMTQAVGLGVASDAGPQQATVRFCGSQSVPVVGKPEGGGIARAGRTLQGGLITDVVAQPTKLCAQGYALSQQKCY